MFYNSFSVLLCPGNTHFAQVGNFFSELPVKKVENIKRALALERGGDVERLLAVLAVADGSVVRHDNCLAVHVGGNCGSDALFDDIQATGVHWLNGNYEDVEFKGRKLRIGGFFEWPRAQLERENSRAVADAMNGETNELDDVCTILICHCPEVLDTSLELYQFDLVLSGHAHGGQVRIGSQGLWSTSQGFLPKYTSGVNQMGESQVVISRGLGDSEPFPRIFNQPELVVVDVN